MLSEGRLVITLSATTDAFVRYYSHVWRWWLCKQDDHSKQWLSNFLGHLPECWHPFLNFVPIKRKETTVTGRAAHSPRVKKRTTRFEPVGDACRGLDENGWGHGRSKPADSYLHTRNPARGRANQRGDFACPNTRAQVPTLVPSQCGCSHCTQRATELSQYVPRCPDHQKEVGATRPIRCWPKVTHKLGGLNRQLLSLFPHVPLVLWELPWSSLSCRRQPGGAESPFQLLLLELAIWGVCVIERWELHRAVLGKHGKLKHSCLLPPWRGSYLCPQES